MAFQDSPNSQSSSTSSSQMPSSAVYTSLPMTTNCAASSFSYVCPQNMLSSGHNAIRVTSPGNPPTVLHEYAEHDRQIQLDHNKTKSNNQSFNSSVILPDDSNQHHNFLTLSSEANHHMNTPSMFQIKNSSSLSYQQRHLQYLFPPGVKTHGLCLERSETNNMGTHDGSAIFQREFHKSSTFDIGHDLTYPQNSVVPSTFHCDYAPKTILRSHYSTGVDSEKNQHVNYNRNMGLVATNQTSELNLPQEFKKHNNSRHVRMITPESTNIVNPSSRCFSNNGRDSSNDNWCFSNNTHINPEYSCLSIYNDEMNQGHIARKDNEIITQPQQSSSDPEITFRHQHRKSNINNWTHETSDTSKWVDEISASNIRQSPNDQKSCSSLTSYFLRQADGIYFQNSREMLQDSHSNTHIQQYLKVESDVCPSLQQVPMYNNESRTYSPFDNTRQHASHTNPLESSRRRESEDDAAKEYNQLQREAAEVSLDFMSRDVQLTSAQLEHNTRSTSPLSPFLTTFVASSPTSATNVNTFMRAQEIKASNRLPCSGVQSCSTPHAEATNNVCQIDDRSDFNQTITGNSASETVNVNLNHHENRKTIYIAIQDELGSQSCCSGDTSIQNTVQCTNTPSNSVKQDKSEKRRMNHGLKNKVPRYKKAKLTVKTSIV